MQHKRSDSQHSVTDTRHTKNSALRFAAAGLGLVLLMGGCAPRDGFLPLVPGGDGGFFSSGQADHFARMAKNAANAGDRQTAIAMMRKVLQEQPRNIQAWNDMGNLLLDEGRYQEAGKAFGKSLERNVNNRDANLGYIYSMVGLGRADVAQSFIEPLVEKSPNDLELLNLAAVVSDLKGEHSRAIEYYQRGLFTDPESTKLRNNLALSLALNGNTDAAVEVLKPVAEGPGTTVQARQNLAFIYGLDGNIGEAERLSAIDLPPEAVSNNLSYFSALRAMKPSQKRSAVLRPDLRASPLGMVKEVERSFALGVDVSGMEPALGPVSELNWVVDLGRHKSAGEASSMWKKIQDTEGQELFGINRLASHRQDSHLIVGPVVSNVKAQKICEQVSHVAKACNPVKIGG